MVIGKCTDAVRGFFWFEGEGLTGGAYEGELTMEEFLMGEEKFPEEGAGFFSIFFKKQ